jgi:hypothetical protein
MDTEEKVGFHLVGTPDPLPERYLPVLGWTVMRKNRIETKTTQLPHEIVCPGINDINFPDKSFGSGISATMINRDRLLYAYSFPY